MSQQMPESLAEDMRAGWMYAHPPPGEEIVISGIAGRYPDSDSVAEFARNIFAKRDLISEDGRRWTLRHAEVPDKGGKINGLEKFDASFFGVHYKQAEAMDPMCRIVLEKTYEALVDAGVHVRELRGTRTGVFLGSCFSESEKTWFYEKLQPHGLALTGCARSMFVNRVSYWLGVDGPSFVTDTACSSSAYALDYAYKSIRDGHVDRAVVGGCHLCLHPYVSLQFSRLGVLNPDGRCKCFDERANGYTRSEAIVIVVLQKAREARRAYATLVHSKANCDGYKEHGITYPSGDMQRVLMEEFYVESGIRPCDVDYIEGHVTGTRVGDPEEVRAIEAVLLGAGGRSRERPLYAGSIKANIGHTEPAAAVCSVSKAIIMLEAGHIPPNINLHTLRRDIPALHNGMMMVATEKTPFHGRYVAVNSFGFGGANCHLLLKRNEKAKVNHGLPQDDLPRLVCVSSRLRDGVHSILDDVASRPLDVECVRLLEEAFKYPVPGHLFRGYALYSKTKVLAKNVSPYEDTGKQLWFLFSGLGSHWPTMGASLLKLPIFASVVERCQRALEKNVDLKNILTSADSKIFENNINMTVGITAVQLGLVDLLKAMKITPSYMIAYSIGEMACAYADESLTLEQAILCSYQIGLASKTKTSESELINILKKVIPSPKNRSDTWVATTGLKDAAKMCSAEYLVRSLSSATSLHKPIPKHSVVVEIAPFGHFQSVFKDCFGDHITTMSLLEREGDNVDNLLAAVGELYLLGADPVTSPLFPEVTFPVSRGTPMLSHLVKWDHAMDWYVVKFESQEKIKSGERTVTVLLSDDEMEYVSGHLIDGRVLFPATGYLYLVWETAGMMRGEVFSDMNVVFENVKFLRATNIPKEGRVYLQVMIQKVSGNFEVIESGQPVVTGTVRVPEGIEDEVIDFPQVTSPTHRDFVMLNKKDVYKELRLRGYNYKGQFQGLEAVDTSGIVGEIAWKGNYVSFMDTMLQIRVMQEDTRGLFVPTCLNKVVIDAYKHKKLVTTLQPDERIPVHFNKETATIRAGGIYVSGLDVSAISRRKPLGEPVLESYKFVPNITDNLTLEQSMRVIVQVAYENVQNIHIRTVELLEDRATSPNDLLSLQVQQILGDLPLIQADINVFTTQQLEPIPGITVLDKKLVTENATCLLVIGTNIVQNPNNFVSALSALVNGGVLISRHQPDFDISKLNLPNVEVVLQHQLASEKLVVVRKRRDDLLQTAVDVSKGDSDLGWLPKLQSACKNDANTVVFAEGDDTNGIIGLVNCIRREPGTDHVRCVFIMDRDAPKFDLKNEFYATQLRKGLGVNVLKGGVWGTYRHLTLPKQSVVKVEHAYVNVTVRGDLSSLRWLEGNLNSEVNLKSNQLLVHIYYSALNFRDIMTATGKIAPEVVAQGRFQLECVQGLEFSGRLANGRRVMGMVSNGGLATMVAADPEFIWDIPDNFSLEDAATVPVVYGTVYYAMVMEGKLRSGESILIHAGSGGVGQAAINLALHYGCTVYTTVGTPEKRQFIKATWPQITDSHIGNSRDTSFEQMVMLATKGRGVDMVLNSLAEEKLQASVRCLAKGGRFMEIGKFDLANNNSLPLALFSKEASFHGIMLDSLFTAPGDMKRKLANGLDKCIAEGAVKPLTKTVFKEDEVEEAFRFMATGKHVGKVLIKLREEEPQEIIEPVKKFVEALPRYIAAPDGCYVIPGGLGGFGLELADWLILRGCRFLVLSSRKGIVTGYQSYRVKTWRSYGVNVHISTADITTFEGCKRLMDEANKIAPVVALFNVSVILRDALLENQTEENYSTSFGPKPVATRHFDELTRRLCPKLRDFVVFSSVSCGRGNAGQTNYGMGNSVMERICEKRRRDGLPALAVEWGAVGEVGLVADMQDNDGELEIGGTLQQRISSCLQCMDLFLRQPDPVVSSMVVAEKKSSIAAGNVIEAVVNILGIRDIKTVSLHSSLAELGMDSIMAVEIKQTLEREFEVFMSAQDIRTLTLTRLQEIADGKEAGGGGAAGEQGAADLQRGVDLVWMMRTIGDEESSRLPVKLLASRARGGGGGRKVLIVPGIEGVSSAVEPLARNLDAEAVCLQLGFHGAHASVREMARELLPGALAQIGERRSFQLVGYSYGAAVALELAALLERDGRVGDIVLVDGSPFMLQQVVKRTVMASTENDFQNNILAIILGIYMTGEDVVPIVNAFSRCPTWDEKIDSIIANAPKNTVHTEQHQRNVCNATYRRLKAICEYEASSGPRLRSAVTLIKPSQPTVAYSAEDLGLGELTTRPVQVLYVEGNHASVLEQPACADIVNSTFARADAPAKHAEPAPAAAASIEGRPRPTIA